MDVQAVRSRVISGVFWVGATKALGQAIAWIITIVVVRLLSPGDYGLMGMAVLVMGFLLLFNELGLGAAIIQSEHLDPDEASSLVWAIFLINVALFVLLLLSAPAVAQYFREPALTSIVRVIGIGFLLNGTGATSMFLLQRELSFKQKSQAEVAGSLAGGVSTLAFALAGFGVWSLVIGYLAQQFTTNALYWLFRPAAIGWPFSWRRVRRFLHFGSQVASARVLWYVSSNADFMVVGRMLGAMELGFYSLAFQFSSLPIEKIVSVVTQVAFPSFSVLQNDDETLRRYFLKLVGVVASVTFPMFLGLFLIADRGIDLFLTAKWAPVALPLKILCLVSCVRAVDTLNAPLVLAKGRPRIILMNSLLKAVLMPAAFYVGARFGLKGVALAWLLTFPVLSLIVTVQTLHLVGLSVARYAAALKHAVAGSAAMVVFTMAVQRFLLAGRSPAQELVATVALGAAVYLGYMVTFNAEMLRAARAMLQRRSGPLPAIVAGAAASPAKTE